MLAAVKLSPPSCSPICQPANQPIGKVDLTGEPGRLLLGLVLLVQLLAHLMRRLVRQKMLLLLVLDLVVVFSAMQLVARIVMVVVVRLGRVMQLVLAMRLAHQQISLMVAH